MTQAPLVDGRLDDPGWLAIPWTEDFVDIQGARRPRPRLRTRARVAWDARYLYVAAELEEPHVWGTLRRRDAVIYHDNDFEVFIDPDGDSHEYYEVEINALATVWDLFLVRPYRDGGPAVSAWDIRGLRAAVAVDGTLNNPADEDRGWSVEMALPWDVLAEAAHTPSPPRAGDRWRLNFSRVEWRHRIRDGRYERIDTAPPERAGHAEDNWVWSPQGLVAMHYPEMWGIVEFSGRPPPPAPLPPLPRLTAGDFALWWLRRIYYREHAFHALAGTYTSDVAALELPEPDDARLAWPPAIEATTTQFSATLSVAGGRTWRIRDDGRVREAPHASRTGARRSGGEGR